MRGQLRYSRVLPHCRTNIEHSAKHYEYLIFLFIINYTVSLWLMFTHKLRLFCPMSCLYSGRDVYTGKGLEGMEEEGGFFFHDKERRKLQFPQIPLFLPKGGALGKDYRGSDKVAQQTEIVVQAHIFSHWKAEMQAFCKAAAQTASH